MVKAGTGSQAPLPLDGWGQPGVGECWELGLGLILLPFLGVTSFGLLALLWLYQNEPLFPGQDQ